MPGDALPATQADIRRLEEKIDKFNDRMDSMSLLNRDRIASAEGRLLEHNARFDNINTRLKEVGDRFDQLYGITGPLQSLRDANEKRDNEAETRRGLNLMAAVTIIAAAVASGSALILSLLH